MTTPSLPDVTVLGVANLARSPEAISALQPRGLSITVPHTDFCSSKVSTWGPCVSDFTLSVGGNDLPVIRPPNYVDTGKTLEMSQIGIVVGNEKKDSEIAPLRNVALDEYLKHFSSFCSHGPPNPVNLLKKSGSDNVVVHQQTVLLPQKVEQEFTEYEVVAINEQAAKEEPSTLVIVSSSFGTRAQILTGTVQKLVQNKNGMNAFFQSQNDSKEPDVLTIVQVPLVRQRVSRTWFGFGAFGAPVSPTQRSKSIVVSPLNVVCACGEILKPITAGSCYDNDDGVHCDICSQLVENEGLVYHCPNGKISIHENGFDLCYKCGRKQMECHETNDRDIERDERFPVIVTILRAIPVVAPELSEDLLELIVDENAKMLSKLIVSPVADRTQPAAPQPWSISNKMPEIPEELEGTAELERMLAAVNLEHYMERFASQEISDRDLPFLNKSHIQTLFTKVGPRARFEAALTAWKGNHLKRGHKLNWLEEFY